MGIKCSCFASTEDFQCFCGLLSSSPEDSVRRVCVRERERESVCVCVTERESE